MSRGWRALLPLIGNKGTELFRARGAGNHSMAVFAFISLRSSLVRNTLLLSVLQASHYVLVLATMPYLARVLGVEQFGLLGIATNIILNLMTFTDWGFGLSAVREVARSGRDIVALRRIFWDTVAARALLAVVSFAAVFIIMASVGFSSPLGWIVLGGSLNLVGGAIATGWFLRGLEIMGPMVGAELIGRILYIPLIFLCVHGPSDTMIASLIGGVGGIISGVLSFRIADRAVPLMPIACTWSGALWQLRDGWHIFLSVAATTLYTQANVILLGAVAGPLQAGLLFGAEKLQRTSKSLIGPLSSAIYPRVNSLLAERPDQAIRLVKRLLVVQGVMSFGIFVALLVSAPYLTLIFFGADFEGAIPAVRWLSGTVFLSGINNVLGTQIMLPFGMQGSFMRIILGAGLFNVAAIVPCSYYLGATGASISILSTESIVTALMGFVIWRARVFSKRPGLEPLAATQSADVSQV
ncbi:MAG: flippase [Beijerinckiaceae bacterium]|nr:flippase [Beijerinckiaceae bacterium]